MRREKRIFKTLFAGVAIILAALPFLVTFSSLLTSLLERSGFYLWLQHAIVPFEARLVAGLIQLVGIKAMVTPQAANFAMLLEKPSGELMPVALNWNCLGWQSLVLLGLTLITGLRGNYSRFSKLQVLVFGVLGTFLVNILRMGAITAFMYYWNEVAARVMHDYVATLAALLWMIFFWWFSFSFVLDPSDGSGS